jgi:translocation and assembly module TamA
VSPFGLIARARGEIERLKTVLESYGYYQASINIQINGMGLNNLSLADTLTALPPKTDAQVTIAFTLGPLYHVGEVTIDGTLPAGLEKAFTLKTGAPAVAADVLAAGSHLRAALEEQGYAFAKVEPPVAYEGVNDPILDVTFHVETGARVNIGNIQFDGLKRVHSKAVRRRLLLRTGQRYNSTAIERARMDLLGMGVFDAISVHLGTEVDDTGGVPVTFLFHERKGHSVSLNAAYSSDLGGSAGANWTKFNVFGNAERLDITTSLINAGGSATTGLGYDADVKFTKPDFWHRDQQLQIEGIAVKQYLQAYDQTAVKTGISLTRKLSTAWTVSIGASTANERIVQETGLACANGSPPSCVPNNTYRITHDYTLIGMPLTAAYNSTGLTSPLDDPLHGMRDSLTITPTRSLGVPSATFIITQLTVAGYFDLDHLFSIGPGRSVFAARAIAGIAQGAGALSLPPDQRFYGGGSNTFRGFQYQGVGPRFPNGIPEGGTALNAGGVEFRQRFGQTLGAAFFVDGGQVSEKLELLPHHFFIGVGAGVRYYTPIGPIRLDVGIPTRIYGPDQDKYEVYIGLGQAY